ncbi:MAG: hypothetical protein R3F43_21640 [bacterium]
MPRLPDGQRVVKTFFAGVGRPPQGVNLAGLLQLPAPGEARQYLVGMHVAISHPQNFGGGSYFEWATFGCRPRRTPPRRGTGRPDLVYNPVCSGGGGGDRPVELAGTCPGVASACASRGTAPARAWQPPGARRTSASPRPGPTSAARAATTLPLGGGTFEDGGAAPGEGEMNPAWLAFLAGQAPRPASAWTTSSPRRPPTTRSTRAWWRTGSDRGD